MKQTSMIPANFDQKNLVEDAVLENIFDEANYLPRPVNYNKHHIYVGFIENEPCMCDIELGNNLLNLTFASSPLTYSKVQAIKARLTQSHDDGIITKLHYEYNNITRTDHFGVEYFIDNKNNI